MNKKKISRKEAILLPGLTESIMNNWFYVDKGPHSGSNPDNKYEAIDMWILTQRNDKQLKDIFGKCSFATNEYEYYTRVWVIEHKDEVFLIYSSEKGTSYELVIEDSMRYRMVESKSYGKRILSFMETLLLRMGCLPKNIEKRIKWQKVINDHI